MFADLSHPTPSSLTGRLALFVWRFTRAFDADHSRHLPAELVRLSDHQLRDIGVDPRSVRLSPHEALFSRVLLRREWP